MDTYGEVAEKAGMTPMMTTRYIRYMRARWVNEEKIQCQTGYAEEWAERFLNKREYEASDSVGKSVLAEIDNLSPL